MYVTYRDTWQRQCGTRKNESLLDSIDSIGKFTMYGSIIYAGMVLCTTGVYGVTHQMYSMYYGITCHSMTPCTGSFYTTYENTLKSYYYTTPTQSHLISWKIWFYHTWPAGRPTVAIAQHCTIRTKCIWMLDIGPNRLPTLFLSFWTDACVIECYHDGHWPLLRLMLYRDYYLHLYTISIHPSRYPDLFHWLAVNSF